jgi:hypothetical protein
MDIPQNNLITGNESVIGIGAQVARMIIESGTTRTQPPEHNYQTKDFVIDNTITDDVQNGVSNYGVSSLGTPVYSQVTFGTKAGQKDNITYLGVDGITTVVLPIITFQSILVSCTLPRNIVKTEIQGRDGTIKEYIGEGDVQISFRGVITGKNGQRPKKEIQDLIQLIKAPITIPVVSDFLNNEMKVWYIVFDERSFEQEEGGYSYQGFSVNAISDNYVELHI